MDAILKTKLLAAFKVAVLPTSDTETPAPISGAYPH
jgi:hypothetical protein